MTKRQTTLALAIVLLLAGPKVAASEEVPHPSITLEARLLAFSPHPRFKCGVNIALQVAKYRVLKVLAGSYTGKEIVVDHFACGGDVFKRIPMGSRVRLNVLVKREYHTIVTHPGIRMDRRPEVFYVAYDPPKKI